MATFAELVSSFDSDAGKRGKQFEHFVKWFLQNDPEWSTQVDQVWLWEEYPERWGVDCGVDLVFRHKNGESWAVQAKCYSQQHDITKHDVDKFLSESNRKGIDKRLLIATTDRMGANAKQVCEAQENAFFVTSSPTLSRQTLSTQQRLLSCTQLNESLSRLPANTSWRRLMGS